MTKRLQDAIEEVIGFLSTEERRSVKIILRSIKTLRKVYMENRESLTLTMQRIEFLENRLLRGDNKRQAARALHKHDPRIAQSTAETLVYTAFSGGFQNPRVRRSSSEAVATATVIQEAPVITTEEDLL